MGVSEIRKPVSRQEPRRLKTRRALLVAGLELMAQSPIDAISIDEIVERAGVAKGSFFNHFTDKSGFAAAISMDIRDRVEETVSSANDGVTDPAERVVRAVSSFVQFARADPCAARIMVRAPEQAARPGAAMNAGVRRDLQLGQANARFNLADLDHGVLYLVGLCQMMVGAVATHTLDDDATRALATDVQSMLLAGLGVEAAEARKLATEAVTLIIR